MIDDNVFICDIDKDIIIFKIKYFLNRYKVILM